MSTTLGYCFILGLLHGILPDEHTWPITFSYAIGSGTSAQGTRTGIYFAAAFTVQRMLMSELSYLALAPFLRSPSVNSIVYAIVGAVMSIAGWVLLRRHRYAHLHLLGHHHEKPDGMDRSTAILTRHHMESTNGRGMPLKWTVIHGFIAGFGIGGFALFVNAVAAPEMPNAWLGFLPGLIYGAGTMVTLAAIGAVFAAGFKTISGLREEDARQFGVRVGATTLFAGGFLFMAAGGAMAMGAGRYLPVDPGYVVIALFVFVVVIPALVYSWRKLKQSIRNEAEYSRGSAPRSPGHKMAE